MRFALVQFAAASDGASNRDLIESRLGELSPPDRLDLVVLPEAAMRDFGAVGDDLGASAEALDGPFVQLLAGHARRLGATIVAGMFEAHDPLPYNTLVVLGPDGTLAASYRKIHLYDSFGYRESDRLSAGDLTPVVIEVAGHRLGLMTCYDVRFPELARALIDAGAQAFVLPSAWVRGEGKLRHWKTLAAARAIENTVPVLAVGQCQGHYVGHSLVLDADGSILAEAADEPVTVRGVIDFEDTDRVRRRNPSLHNRRMRSGS